MLEVTDLLDVDPVDAQRETRHEQREEIAEPTRVGAGSVEGDPADGARVRQAVHDLAAVHLRVHVADRRDDVLAAREEPAEVVEVGTGIVAVHERRQRHVQDDVGVERHDLVDVVGRRDAEVGETGERPMSRPTLSGSVTSSPTMSMSGRPATVAIDARPTFPLPHCTTLIVMPKT